MPDKYSPFSDLIIAALLVANLGRMHHRRPSKNSHIGDNDDQSQRDVSQYARRTIQS